MRWIKLSEWVSCLFFYGLLIAWVVHNSVEVVWILVVGYWCGTVHALRKLEEMLR